jgi:hypothetical protein
MNSGVRTTRILLVSLVGSLAQPAAAELVDPLGILTPQTLAGFNPITFERWKVGDQYRLVFITSSKITATSTDIAIYNAWVQGLANRSPYGIGANQGVTWKVIGSTDSVDARDNTSTNPQVNGLGCPIYLLDGNSLVAQGNNKLWSGTISRIIDLTEQGQIFTGWPWTGSFRDGTRAVDHSWSFNSLGGTLPEGNDIFVNQGNSGNSSRWMWYYWTGDPPDTLQPMYALSDPITIIDALPVVVPLKLAISKGVEGYDLRWTSQAGKLYDLVSSTSLDTPPSTWTIYGGHADMLPSGTGINILTGIPMSGARRFFAIIER